MRKSRMILISIITAVMVIAFMTGTCNTEAASSGTCGDQVTWTLDDQGTLTISGSGEIDSGLPVFEDISSEIKKVVIESGVTKIGQLNFYQCENLKTVILANTVTAIDGDAFEECSNLSSITLSNNLKSIGGFAFYKCESLTSITLPNSLKTIGSAAIADCWSLTDVYYMGSQKEWEAINIGDYNYSLDNATIHFSKVAAPSGKTLTYNGKVQTGVAAGDQYTISGNKATKAGSYTATLTLKDKTRCTWTDGTTADKKVSWTIKKAANPLKVKGKTAKISVSKLKKKNLTLAPTKVFNFTNSGQGTKTYKKVSGNKKITISKTTGKVTIKKKLKKGNYKVIARVKAAGNSNYNASSWKTVIFNVRVK